MTSASSFVPLWNRADEWARRLAMIRRARRFLYLSTFYIEYDGYGIELLDALDEAASRGVVVNLLIDSFGQRLGGVLMSSAHKAALEARLAALGHKNAVVTYYHPARVIQRKLGGGQHVKIQVSDEGDAIFGSSNITRSSFEGWNEYSVAVRGPVAALLLDSYRDIGGTVDEAHIAWLRAMAHEPSPHIELEYWFCNPNLLQGASGPLGWPGPNVVTDQMIAMIDEARHSLSITSFYFKPVEPVLAALVRAAARGVAVEVHHSHRDALPATELAWLAAAVTYPRLLAAGVRIWENRHGEHSKIVLVDEAWAAFGSYNFEDAAHDRLAEAMLASRDPRTVGPAVAIFDELRQHPDNMPVTAETVRTLPVRLKVKRAVFGRFKRWM